MKLMILLASLFLGTASLAQENSARTALNSPKDLQCRAPYQRLFSQSEVSIRIVFGYKDTRPSRFVGDRNERLAFVQRILAPCKGTDAACGFSRHPDYQDLFSKTIPGLNDKPLKVNLVVVNSSVGSDDVGNRTNPMQNWQSGYAKSAFLNGLQRADVVFYNGHSRFGGGPDFAPPKLRPSGDVNADFYRSSQTGFQEMQTKLQGNAGLLDNLSSTSDGLKMLGLFSCTSSQHFSRALTSDKQLGLISSGALLYYADAMENSLAALSALLEMKCEKDFRRAIREGVKIRGSHLNGFF